MNRDTSTPPVRTRLFRHPTSQPVRLLLRPQETVNALEISPRNLMNMVDANEIPVVQIGIARVWQPDQVPALSGIVAEDFRA